MADSEPASGAYGWRTHLVVALVAVALVAPIAFLSYRNHLGDARRQVAQMAALKATWLETWFDERTASAGLSGTSFPQAEMYLAWQRDGELAARDLLLRRLRDFAEAGGFSGVALLAPSGLVLWTETAHGHTLGAWHPAWEADGEEGDGVRVRSYRDGEGVTHVDFVVALPVAGAEARPHVVYHASPTDLVPSHLGDWVTHTLTGRVAVVRRFDDGVSVVGSERRAGDGDPVVSETIMPGERTDVVAVRLALGATGDAPLAAEGSDRHGVRVLAAGSEAGDTGWIVVALIERREALAGFGSNGVAAVLAVVVAYLVVMAALEGLRQQKRAAVARGVELAEVERQRAMRLLAAVADASPDPIFAKDLDGRYTLVNRAGAELVGRPIDEVLDRTDGDLFPEADAKVSTTKDREIVEQRRTVTFEEQVTTAAGPRVMFTTKGPLVDEGGSVTGTFGISRDVTERRAAEHAAADQAATLRAAIADHERFNRVLIDRELAMVALKRRVNAYAVRLGEAPPFQGEAIAASGNGDG